MSTDTENCPKFSCICHVLIPSIFKGKLLRVKEIITAPWHTVILQIMESLQSRINQLTLIDYQSTYPAVMTQILITSNSIIKALKVSYCIIHFKTQNYGWQYNRAQNILRKVTSPQFSLLFVYVDDFAMH